MRLSEISKNHISIQRKKYWNRVNKRYKEEDYFVWKEGWDAAIRFLSKMEDKDTFCCHCGKAIALEEMEWFGEDVFCKKCFRKLYK